MPRVHEMMESKYLKKEEVGEDGAIVTVKKFERVNVAMDDQTPDMKWVMHLHEFEKPMVMNSTNIQLAEKAMGSDNTDDWIGNQLILYLDPNVSFGGKIVGGIRIRAHRQNRAAPRPSAARRPVDDDDLQVDPRD